MRGRPFSRLALLTLPSLAVAGLMAGAAASNVAERKCDEACQAASKARDVEYAVESIARQLDEMSSGRECWKPGTRKEFPTTVLAHGAARNRAGDWGFDTTVVKAYTFDQAWALASKGEIWVDLHCIDK